MKCKKYTEVTDDEDGDSPPPDYPLADKHICVKQVMINLNSEMKEAEIRQKIVVALYSKLPHLKEHAFHFVKRDKGKICTPVTDSDFRFDYAQVKKLSGQGKIYIRLHNSQSLSDDSSDEDLPDLPYIRSSIPEQQKPSSSNQDKDFLTRLSEIFPDAPLEMKEDVASKSCTIAEAANLMVEYLDNHQTMESTSAIADVTHNQRKRLFVDKESITEDCLSYYKRKDFDPTKSASASGRKQIMGHVIPVTHQK